MTGNFRNIKRSLQGFLVKCFYIKKNFIELQIFSIYLSVNKGIEDKGVIRAGGVTHRKLFHLLAVFLFVIFYCFVQGICTQV